MYTFTGLMERPNSGWSQRLGLQKTMGYLIHNWLKSEKLLRSTLMSSPVHGIPSSGAEITNISSHGLWLLSNDTEYFLSEVERHRRDIRAFRAKTGSRFPR